MKLSSSGPQTTSTAERLATLVARTAAARTEGHTYDVERHHELARTAAAESAVLLANDGELLPLTPGGQTVAVIGEFACSPRYQGAGSSQVVPTKLDNALDAILDLEGADRVTFAPGFTFDGTPDDDMVTEAVDAARRADVAVLFLGLPSATESEGFDRTDIELPADQIGAAGSSPPIHIAITASKLHKKPVQITLRAFAKPYTSVKMSPKIKEIGKNKTPAPKVRMPKNGTSICEIFAGPIKFDVINTVTNAAMTRS